MFCPKCGTSNEDGAAFCASCGAPMVDNSQPQMTAPQAPVQPQFTAQQPQFAAAAPRKPLSPKAKMGIIIAAVVCVLLIAFIATGSILSNPERVVKKFFSSTMAGEWDKAFKYVDLPEGEFITKDLFEKALEDEETSDITNFEVTEEEYSDSDISKTYYITYYEAGSSKSTTYVDVVKSGKFMLFWDNYKVSADDLVTKNLRITVNAGSKLYLDDIEVGDKYVEEDTDSNSTTKTYKIDYVFMGDHKVKATHDVYEDVEKERSFTYKSDDTISLMGSTQVKDSIVKERQTAAENDMKTIFAAAIANKDFNTIKDLCVSDSSYQNKIKSAYESFLSKTYNSGYGITKVDYTSISTDASSGTKDSAPYVKVTVKAKVSADYNTKKDGTKNTTDTISSTFTYMYKDGQWKLSAVSLDSIYFYKY